MKIRPFRSAILQRRAMTRRGAVAAQRLRRRAIASGASLGIPGGSRFYTRQLKQRNALPAQRWPGHRRVIAEGLVFRPASLRTALRPY
jgi:hypothetical protein